MEDKDKGVSPHKAKRQHNGNTRGKSAQKVRDDRVDRAESSVRNEGGQFIATGTAEKRRLISSRRTPSYLPVPPDYPWGKKRWLKRREINWEYGMCARTIRRAEIDGHLNPSVLRGEYLYRRDEVERAIENNRLRITAAGTEAATAASTPPQIARA